jgi:hypothetical protein
MHQLMIKLPGMAPQAAANQNIGYNIYIDSILCSAKKRRRTMGDKGGKKDKEKSQKQKTMKHVHDIQQKKDKQPKSLMK